MARAVNRPAGGMQTVESQPLVAATWLGLCAACLTLLLLGWLPISELRQIDALVAYEATPRILRNVAIAALVVGAIAVAWATVAWLASRAMRPLFGAASAELLGWIVNLLPALVVTALQSAAAAKQWLEVTQQITLPVNRTAHLLSMALAVALLGLLAWRYGLRHVVRFVQRTLQAATPITIALLVASVVTVFVKPPRLVGETSVRTPLAAAGTHPDIVLITIDALSGIDADVCGDGPTPMPRLRAFAKRATCFSHFYASSNFTVPTTSTIETGYLPWTHRAVQLGADIEPAARTAGLAGALSRAGYSTSMVSANILAMPRHHGTDTQYDREELARSPSLSTKIFGLFSQLADASLSTTLGSLASITQMADVYLNGGRNPFDPAAVYDRGLALLAAPGPRAPQFLWVHTLPPHSPYLPPATTRHRLLAAGELESWKEFLPENYEYSRALQPLVDKHRLRYQESIMGADEGLSALLAQLEDDGRFANTVIVISADHGESFEKGYLGHAGQHLDEPLIRIPLIIRLPGADQHGQVDMPVSQADLAPTLEEIAGATIPAAIDGRSLLPMLHGQEMPARPVFSMAMESVSRFAPVRGGHYAVMEGSLKLIEHRASGHAELYDLAADPHELVDLAGLRPDDRDRLASILRIAMSAAETQHDQKNP